MTIEQLRMELTALIQESARSPEEAHIQADMALIAYINDPEVTELYEDIEKWYA